LKTKAFIAALAVSFGLVTAAAAQTDGNREIPGTTPGQSIWEKSASFRSFLYNNSSSAVEYIENSSSLSPFRTALIASIGITGSNLKVSVFKLTYANTNFPEYAVLFHRNGNSKLLVYNCGHTGIPTSTETFETVFMNEAVAAGFDLLYTSMPLLGINSPDPAESYWMIAAGNKNKVPVDSRILSASISWPLTHSVFEMLDDPDHYMHFFIDGMVLPSAFENRGKFQGTTGLFRETKGFPNLAYQKTVYVGLSGGGATGLSACAVYPFDECVLIAGFLPDYLRVQNVNDLGDAEQVSASLYLRFPYEDIIAVAESVSKKIVYIYNANDSCCFSDPQASQFKADFPELDIRVTPLAYHGYIPEDILALIQ
jgi:hypothetical protein